MKTLYELLLKSKYQLAKYYGEKAFTFKEVNGEWSKQFTVSKFGKKYDVCGFEGTENMIIKFEVELDTYKEVVKYLGI